MFAFLVHDQFATSAVPSWLPLVLLAIFVFFSARKEELQSEPELLDIARALAGRCLKPLERLFEEHGIQPVSS